MDRLSIFSKASSEVIISSNSLETLTDELGDIRRELILTRKGHEEWTWGEEVADSEIDLSDLEPQERE